ncbi:hypothetical protein GGQ88_001361 [Novosphingobium hassiacum]|uniref:Uncharacterized protein n=1 Tax=Novosphingobium hassiacum TaxID=173676 RepID=A0A7W5ZYM4_9SPHN|nr:hypothetical protein [Novosphingobium hassiacum]MBB3860100.1 hypothetical protein [Novosphingobium hassiacum]
MAGKRTRLDAKGVTRLRSRAPLAATAAAIVLGLFLAPTVSSAFSSGFDAKPVSLAARGGIGSFTPASVDERLASQITVRALNGKQFRFTPAGNETRPGRAVTVAVRLDSQTARAFSVRSVLAEVQPGAGASPVRIAPTAFNLGMARGYTSFAPSGASSALHDLQRIEMPDLARIKPSAVKSTPSRFAPRVEVDDRDRAGRAPRTLEGQGDYQVELGGSYRLTRNLNVNAGVRYSPERDRLLPLTDGKQDNQAVYVGTQFRF